MRFFSREYAVDYPNYRFAYGNFAELEALAELDTLYARGYLPWSAEPEEQRPLFYMARSLRVDLTQLQMTKKRRYLQRQEPMSRFKRCLHEREQLLQICDAAWVRKITGWMERRFGEAYLSCERIEAILQKPFANTLLEWCDHETPVAWALVCRSESSAHYWFCFYNPEHPEAQSLGKWLLGDFLEWATSEDLRFGYLGTGYKDRSAYKVHGIRPCAFWDGSGWIDDAARLRQLQALDG